MRKKYFLIISIVIICVILFILFSPAALRLFRYNHLIYLQRLGKYDEAINEYKQFVKLYSPGIKELKRVFNIYLLNRSFSEAIQTGNKIMAQAPEETEILWQLGFLYHITGQLNKAQQAFQSYINLARHKIGRKGPQVKFNTAQHYLALWSTDWYGIAKMITPLVETKWEKEMPLRLSRFYQGFMLDILGISNFKAHRYYEAIQQLEKALENNYNDVTAYYYLGLTHGFAANLDLAHYYLTISRLVYPEIVEFEVANTCRRFRMLNEASHAAEAQNLLYILGYCGKEQLALNLAEELQITTSSLSQVCYLRGLLYEWNGNEAQAITQYERALQVMPDCIPAKFKLNQLTRKDDLLSGIGQLFPLIIEPEENMDESSCRQREFAVGLARNIDYYVVRLRPPHPMMKLGIIARGDLREGIGPLLGINVNGLLLYYKYVPTTHWHLIIQELEFPEGEVELKITYHNNFIPGLDTPESEEDRNLIIEKILLF